MTVEVPEAPIFRPTAQEFADPLSYISSIQATAAAAGIAKIVPPPGVGSIRGACAFYMAWKQLQEIMGVHDRNRESTETAGWKQSKVQLDSQQLFSTKRQKVHALQEGQPFSEVSLHRFHSSATCPVPASATVILMLLSRSDMRRSCCW